MVIFNDETFEERFIFRLTRMNVLSVVLSLAIIFTLLTFLLIVYSPIKEMIPGYPSIYQRESLISLNIMADSLQKELDRKDLFFENIKNIVKQTNIIKPIEKKEEKEYTQMSYDTIKLKKSVQDSLLRLEFESQNF